MASTSTAADTPLFEWYPARLLQKTPRIAAKPHVVVVLNQPLASLEPAQRVWKSGTFVHARGETPPRRLVTKSDIFTAQFRVAADGGANQLHDVLQTVDQDFVSVARCIFYFTLF